MKIKSILIDCDPCIYKAGWSCADKETKEPKELKVAIYGLKAQLSGIVTVLDGLGFAISKSAIHLYVSIQGADNFRFKVDPLYKANRKDAEKPPHYEEMRQYLISELGAKAVVGEEADDAIGVEACRHNQNEVIICSTDKDLRMIPSIRYEMNDFPIYQVSDPGCLLQLRNKGAWKWWGTGLRWFYFQLLNGDTVDNIKRPWKYKPGELAKAVDTLNSIESPKKMYEFVLQVYLTKGSDYETLLRNGQLLWIRRKEGELWTPPL